MTLVAPSILAADWGRLNDEVQRVVQAGADWIHLDVMDGSFVPPITFGAQVVKAVRAACAVKLDVHLMIERPEQHIEAFRSAGADLITVHYEACRHLHRAVQQIKELGALAGVCVNPATPVSLLAPICSDADLILIMSVNPGWGGQQFIASSVERVREAAALISASRRDIRLEVDGGINEVTGAQVVGAGADVLVAGTYIFGSKDYAGRIRALKGA